MPKKKTFANADMVSLDDIIREFLDRTTGPTKKPQTYTLAMIYDLLVALNFDQTEIKRLLAEYE